MAKHTSWGHLDSQTQEDLIAWRNIRESDVTAEDRAQLAELFAAGRFEAWTCVCGERVYRGDPENWGHFQGVNQVDYVSYPGNEEKYTQEYLARLCDTCRMGSV